MAAAETHRLPVKGLVSLNFFDELKRKNVSRVGIAYIIVARDIFEKTNLPAMLEPGICE